jgi:flagellar basal-body rod protein FlgB
MAQALAAHAGARLGVVAQNVAHADTPGYKARDIADFAESFAPKGEAMRSTRPQHFHAPGRPAAPAEFETGGSEAPNGNTVSLEKEMVKSVEVRQSHEMALAIYRATSEVIRASLGRKG